jgi:hypothetical protein
MMSKTISNNRPPELYFLFILGFTLNYALWFALDPFAEHLYICSRFFQNCGDFISFKGFPASWDTSLLYESVFLSLVASVFFFLKGKQRISLGILLYPLALEALLGFIVYENTLLPVVYYQFFPCLIYIFSKDCRNDLKWLVPLFYLCASSVKLDSGWLLAKEFDKTLGMPLLPEILVLPALWFFFFLELTSFALLSRSKIIHTFYLCAFCMAHLYAFIFTGYHFQLMALPLVFFVFQDKSPLRAPSPLFMVCAAYLIFVNLLPHITDSNYKITGQGDGLAFDMVDARRKIDSRITTFNKDGTSHTEKIKGSQAYEKRSPYKMWFELKKRCTPEVERISWTLKLSLNYDPFKKIVDVQNLCTLKFDPFFKNDWIKAEGI